MSPEKGGVLRTDVRRAFRRSILVVAAVVLPVAPLSALGSSTPRSEPAKVALSTPLQQPLAEHTASIPAVHESVSALLRHFVILPKVVHHAAPRTVHHVAAVHHVVHRVIHHRRVPPRPAHRGFPHQFHRIGIATWYSWHPGECASSYRPHGSRIWIRDLETGRVITCLVTDTQAYSPQRVVDLSETQFAELAPLSTGIVRVEVFW